MRAQLIPPRWPAKVRTIVLQSDLSIRWMVSDGEDAARAKCAWRGAIASTYEPSASVVVLSGRLELVNAGEGASVLVIVVGGGRGRWVE